MYNTNKKVTQYSGIQCVNWDETTAGEKAFWAERIAEVGKIKVKPTRQKLKQETHFCVDKKD